MGRVDTTGALQAVTAVGALAARDPGSTRVVYAVVVLLVVLGVSLAVFAWWLARTTRPDPEVLAPLEAIDSRQWRRLDPAGRRRLLDELRPDGAEPIHREPLAPEPDAEFTDAPAPADVRELADDRDTSSPRDDPGPDDTAAGPSADPAEDTAEDTAADPAPEPRAAPSDEDWERWDETLGLRPADDRPGGTSTS